jgi:hypothetical protein
MPKTNPASRRTSRRPHPAIEAARAAIARGALRLTPQRLMIIAGIVDADAGRHKAADYWLLVYRNLKGGMRLRPWSANRSGRRRRCAVSDRLILRSTQPRCWRGGSG